MGSQEYSNKGVQGEVWEDADSQGELKKTKNNLLSADSHLNSFCQ